MTAQNDNIYLALNRVMAAVGYVAKEKKQGLNYSFAGEAALIAAIRPHLVEQQIIVYPESFERLESGSYTTSRGATMNHVVVQVTYKFTHAPSGTSINVSAIGEGADIGDKAANKANTGAYKYALRQALMIETGDDPDKYASEDLARDSLLGYPKDVLEAIVNADPAVKHINNVVNVFEKTKLITPENAKEYGLRWYKQYRAKRQKGVSVPQSVKHADTVMSNALN